MKKTSPLVVALLLQICDIGNAVKISSHTHTEQSNFLNAHDYDL